MADNTDKRKEKEMRIRLFKDTVIWVMPKKPMVQGIKQHPVRMVVDKASVIEIQERKSK